MVDTATLSREYQGPERREEPPSVLSGLPTWARAAAVLGVPGVIALYLVWMGANDLPKITREIEGIKIASQAAQTRMAAAELKADQIYRMLQRICSRVSETEQERAGCFEP